MKRQMLLSIGVFAVNEWINTAFFKLCLSIC